MTIWEPKNGEFLETRLEKENELDKYAVAAIKSSFVFGKERLVVLQKLSHSFPLC